jgi:hypothetical protein
VVRTDFGSERGVGFGAQPTKLGNPKERVVVSEGIETCTLTWSCWLSWGLGGSTGLFVVFSGWCQILQQNAIVALSSASNVETQPFQPTPQGKFSQFNHAHSHLSPKKYWELVGGFLFFLRGFGLT